MAARQHWLPHEHNNVRIFQNISPSVVKISRALNRTTGSGPRQALDPKVSGFVWNHDGIIVTNSHVISFAHENEVPVDIGVTFFNGICLTAHMVAFSPHKDIAILKLDGEIPNWVVPIQAGDISVEDLCVGQLVFIVRHPYGLRQSLTHGLISGFNVELPNNGSPIQGCIQVDCTTNPGNSGSPLLDSMGRLIGMHTSMQLFTPGNGFSGLGFSIPVDTIRRVVGELLEHGRISLPGLGVKIASNDLIRPLGMEGIVVLEADPLSGGGSAGLISADLSENGINNCDVITAIDGISVFNKIDLFRIVDWHSVGDKVNVEFTRYMGGVEVPMQIEVTLQDEVLDF